ncbi:hypothetical protein ACFLZ6_02015 [Nanoarchaeota archaeon]
MDEDMPKTTIVVLLVLTVIISIACTWVVLDKSMGAQVVYPGSSAASQASGEVKINIKGVEQVSAPKITGEASGIIGINVN